MSASTPTDPDVQLLTADGSLTKTVLVQGQGEPAGRDARVSLRYSLRLSDDLNEPSFDSSAKRKDGVLRFTLGKKKVIPALELVAQSMTQGERCVARSAAAYAFGARGLERKGVPGGAVVYLEVEMLEVEGGQKVKMMAEMNPRERFLYAKECKEMGNVLFKEQKFDKALVQYSKSIQYLANVFYRPSGEVGGGDKKGDDAGGSSAEEKGEEGFEGANIVEGEGEGEGEREGEREGTVGQDKENDQPVEGKLNVNGVSAGKSDDVDEVIDVTPSSVSNTASEQVVNGAADADQAQEGADGNNTQQEGESAADVKEGEESGDVANADDDDPDEKEVRALHVTTLNNLSLCCVRLEHYRKAVETASLAIKLDPQSSKALYYRGRARIFLGEWESARADLVAALELWDNPGIKNEILRLDRKRKQFAEREKKQAAAMFA